jgi:hypothetical protein
MVRMRVPIADLDIAGLRGSDPSVMWEGWAEMPYAWRRLARMDAIDAQLQKGAWERTAFLELERESLRREVEILFPHREWR